MNKSSIIHAEAEGSSSLSFPTSIGWLKVTASKDCILQITSTKPGTDSEALDWEDAGNSLTARQLLRQAQAEILEYLDGTRTVFTFPVQLSGTPFQQAVYEAAMQVPYGKTASYGELAKRAGKPKAARAVGTAMKNNPLILVVPCHRIIQANGRPGNYSGCSGPATKAFLLDLESRASLPFFEEEPL